MATVVALAIGGLAAPFTATAAPAQAELRVAANGQGTACSVAQPCALPTAMAQAQPGAVVRLAAGNYGAQELKGGKGTAAAPVSVVAAAGVTFARIDTYLPHVVWDGVRVTEVFYLYPAALGSTVRNAHLDGAGMFVRAANSRILDSVFEGGSSIDALQIKQTSNVLVEGNTMSGYDQNGTSGLHADCVQLFDTSGITIRGNSIRNCYNAGIIFSVGGGTGIRDVLVESNFVQGCIVKSRSCNGGTALDLRETSMSGVTVRNNTFLDGAVRVGTGLRNVVFDRNIVGFLSDCASPMTNSVIESWNKGVCSLPAAVGKNGNRVAQLKVKDRANGDLHLTDHSSATITPTGSFSPAPKDFDGSGMPATLAGADAPGQSTGGPAQAPTAPSIVAPVQPAPAPALPAPPAVPSTPSTPADPQTPVARTPAPVPTKPVPGPRDRTAPNVSIVAPRTGSVTPAQLTVRAKATDASGIAQVSFWVGATFLKSAKLAADGSWVATGSTEKVPAGRYQLVARAMDRMGNLAVSKPVTVVVAPKTAKVRTLR